MAAPTILDVPTILQCAELAGGYACMDRARKNQFYGGYVKDLLPEKIQFVRKRVQNRYDKNPTDSTLRDTANLLWDLIAQYGIRALNNLQAGGVVITPSTNVGSYLTVLKNYPQFVVGESGSPMADGQTELTITDSLIVPESALGEVEVHLDGGELGTSLLDRQSFTPVYSAGQYIITFVQGVLGDNLVQIKYPIRQTLVYQSGTPSPTPSLTVYTAVLDGAVTDTLVDTDGNIYPITAGTQGMLTINLAGQDTDNNAFAGFWQYYVNNIGGTITLALSNGGIYQPYSGGDISSNIVISGDNGLGGVKIEATGFTDKIITVNATFSYSSFNI